jgi:hypothetical protein
MSNPKTKVVRKKKSRLNGYLILVILATSLITVLLFSFNIFKVASKTTTAEGTTLEVDSSSKISNDKYIIGNNPTELLRENFKELTSALKEKDPYVIAEYVARCFVIDHFTWTNKDGNYEVGGLQYIYGPKFTSFSDEARYGFYSDLDLYISQFGRENLLQVESVESHPALDAGIYKVGEEEYTSYYLDVTWTYKKSSKINVDEFQKIGHFTIVDNNGRFEIVSMYDDWDSETVEEETIEEEE